MDLGLVYECDVKANEDGTRTVEVKITLTAPGCGMGEILVDDVRDKIRRIPTVREVKVELTFDPPWNQSMMTEAARLADRDVLKRRMTSMSSKWVDVGDAKYLSETEPLAVFAEGFAIAIVRCGESVYAVQDLCTHDGETLGNAQVEDCQIICPRHGAHFCLRTGQPLTPPAYEPLQTFAARVENGRVLVELPA